MESLLVISNEPALAETLASELTEFAVNGIRANDAESCLHNGNFCLVIIDNDTNYTMDSDTENVIRLTRPIRLRDAIYTISRQLKSKTASAKEETELSPGVLFSPTARQIRAEDGTPIVTLTEKEVELLQELTKNSTEVLSRDILLKKIWGYGEDINTHTLETHIYRLRGKLKQANESLDIVFSEENGYRFRNISV